MGTKRLKLIDRIITCFNALPDYNRCMASEGFVSTKVQFTDCASIWS